MKMGKTALLLAVILFGAGLYLALGPGIRKAQGDSEAMATKAINDLACRLGITENDVEVVSVEEVTWPDTSLGCPEPGMFYAQMLTPGFRIILRAKGKQYEYHTDKKRVVKLCPEEQSKEGAEAPPASGVRLAYLKEPERADPNLNLELWVRDLESAKEKLLTSGVSEFHFSPDKKNIALVKRTSRSGLELSLAKSDGSERKPYWTCVAISSFAWAPDSKHFAFLSREKLSNYNLGIVIGSLEESPPGGPLPLSPKMGRVLRTKTNTQQSNGPVYLPAGEKMLRGELSWDSSSSTVLLSSYSDGSKCDVWAIPLESRQPKVVIKDVSSARAL
jgi:hypothetical protein